MGGVVVTEDAAFGSGRGMFPPLAGLASCLEATMRPTRRRGCSGTVSEGGTTEARDDCPPPPWMTGSGAAEIDYQWISTRAPIGVHS